MQCRIGCGVVRQQFVILTVLIIRIDHKIYDPC